MTAQENTVDRLALAHGRVLVRQGYADHALRVTAENGAHWLVDEDGVARESQPDHTTIEWI